MMNSLLELTIYDKRQGKAKELKYEPKPLVENKLKGKSKSLNRNDRVNRAARGEKYKKETGKSRENLATLDNSIFGSLLSLSKDVRRDSKQNSDRDDRSQIGSILTTKDVRKEPKRSGDHDNARSNCSDIDSAQLRKKPIKNVVAPPVKAENFIGDAINGFNYTGSIELKFEEALEVCADNLYDEIDEEFGRNLFDDESDNYILEAYNKPGDELIETYIEVEHQTRIIPENQEKRKGKPQIGLEEKKSLCLISDDEECIFVEAYNSIGHELRKTYSLIDKTLPNIDEDFQKRTLSITSDVQEYFNDIENKCENEDLRQPAPNTYMKYSRIIDEYRNSRQAANLKQLHDSNGGNVEGKRGVRDVDLPQPSDVTLVNYSKMVDEYKHSKQAANLKKFAEDDCEGAKSDSSDEQSYVVPSSPVAVKFVPKTKSDFIIHELLETELVYIKNLKKILNDYLSYFRKFPSHFQSKVSVIFGNIEDIYRKTVEFYNALSVCSNDYEAIALTFVDYKYLFQLYPIYMKNKPRADRTLLDNYKAIIEDRQKKLKDRLDLMSYLLNPIQRLGRYILLLENLQKSVRRSGCLDPAIDVLKRNMKKGNDSIAVESILKVPESLDLYRKGSYVDREKFTMIKPRRQETVLFLFEEIVVFTVENITARRDVHTTFVYNASIDMNDLSITIVDGEAQTFQLMDYPKCKKNKEEASYVFEAKDKKTRDNWGALIQGRLWAQLEKFKDQSKSYKSVSRSNSTTSAKVPKYIGNYTPQLSASTSVSREDSTKSKKDTPSTSVDRRKEKTDDKMRRRTKKPRSDAAKRTSRFYTDPQNYKTM